MNDDTVAHDVSPKRCPARQLVDDFELPYVEHLNPVAGNGASPVPPVLDGGRPLIVVLRDVAWPNDDDVDVALGVSLTSSERPEDDHADWSNAHLLGHGADAFQCDVARTGELDDDPCRHVLAVEP